MWLTLMAAWVTQAATCENQDYYLPQRLHLEGAAPFDPAAVDIEQPYLGLNAIDFRVTNEGSEAADFALAVEIGCGGVCSFEGAPGPCCSDRLKTLLWRDVAPGDSVSGRLNQSALGLGDRLHVEFHCFTDDVATAAVCTGTLDYLLQLRQVDCRGDVDCSSSEFCDREQGICRIQPETEEGCQVATSVPGDASGLLLGIGWIVIMGLRRRISR